MTRETAPSGERRGGTSKLVYNKERRTIDTVRTDAMTARPFDAEQMAREIAIGLDRRGFGFDEEVKAYAAALQSQHDAHEAEVRGLRLVCNWSLTVLGGFEPGDSRAVSNEFVAAATLESPENVPKDKLDECEAILRAALKETSQ